MIAERIAPPDPSAPIAVAALRSAFGDLYAGEFAVRLWDGTQINAQQQPPRFTLCINDAGALRAAFRPPIDLNAGRAFAAGLIDCEGDVEAAVDTLYRAIERLPKRALPNLLSLLMRLPKAELPPLREARLRGKLHSRERDRAAIGFHYDQPIAFYRAFLDRAMLYSCAYFDDGIDSLDDAQTAKIDYTLRKLRLQPGETLLDMGCGWGALVVRAAQKFGARALGVTLSHAQADEARRRIAGAGLAGQARVQSWDYRELADEEFDKIVSIGMFEHVGRSQLPAYFARAHAMLKPGGLFLNHGIADQNPARNGGRRGSFVERFVFPDGELVAISEALALAERAGFEIRDVENLREHYVRTLRCWVRNLERNREQAIEAAGEQPYRTWRLYMAGSAQGFRIGRLGLFQSLLAKPQADGSVPLPPTRRDLFTS